MVCQFQICKMHISQENGNLNDVLREQKSKCKGRPPHMQIYDQDLIDILRRPANIQEKLCDYSSMFQNPK